MKGPSEDVSGRDHAGGSGARRGRWQSCRVGETRGIRRNMVRRMRLLSIFCFEVHPGQHPALKVRTKRALQWGVKFVF